MVVSLYHYKIQRSLRRLSRTLQMDVSRALATDGQQGFTFTREQEAEIQPDMGFLEEEGLLHFWRLSEDEAVIAPGTSEYVVVTLPDWYTFMHR